ncbi:hypothetical protein OIU85_005228 [Salix viminalis]|uniref:DNA-directed RNA polymerase I subunit RPA12 n=2 Tax=Salix TaxID=40685 RepID=A0A9Q0PU74_SALVM|nr:hypothetical protein OIU85_005228 [Salix viminalis]
MLLPCCAERGSPSPLPCAFPSSSVELEKADRRSIEMAHARGADFMFCDLCGTMMFLYSKEHVECPSCKFKKSAKDLSEREISYQVSSEDMRRDLGISHFEGKMEVKDMEINKTCEKCGHTKLKFSTRQMRSADEGQTTFFHCANCLYTFTEN